ncbi:GATA transcription factor 4 [Acorus calamus]|uniref:GATA transcription factor 4 n=1 Tax=Acorus calamus TaxID=4465 RepID=A0AAV9C5U2_ACOCL|nr:GATA transcription factor 4 [Acorus calamus]
MVSISLNRSSFGGHEMEDFVGDILNEEFEDIHQQKKPPKIINIFDGDIKPSLLIEEDDEEDLEWSNSDFPMFDLDVFALKGVVGDERDDGGFSLHRQPAAAKGRRSERRRRRRVVRGFEVVGPVAAKGRRRCTHCEVEETPQWRAGPYGPKTLCNACGVRYKSGRLVPEYRPANSPTFSSEKHSNSHRKILAMRRKNGVEV